MSLPINGRPLSSSSIGQRIGGEIRTAASTFRQLINMPMLAFCNEEIFFSFFLPFFFFHTLFFAAKFFKLMKHANRTRNDQSGILRFLNFLTGEKTFFYSFFNNKHKYFTFHAFICYNDNLCNINWARTVCFEKREKKYRSSSKELNVSFKAEWKWNEQNEASKYARYMVKSRNARTVEEATRIGKGTRKEEEQESRRRRVQGKKGLEGSREGKATTFWWFILQYWPAISQRVENLFTRWKIAKTLLRKRMHLINFPSMINWYQ